MLNTEKKKQLKYFQFCWFITTTTTTKNSLQLSYDIGY